ncbi:MAG: NUDIX domain-containing protein [Holosporales bacterium]|jgi:8-oxo-dGTP pyrophosphatase MutT (NUDIX family)|nr:NUDIX domain-containing protein [Holosporales bacterium]
MNYTKEQLLNFEYADLNEGREIRSIIPIAIKYEQNAETKEWLLEGFDVKQNCIRLFLFKNISRIINVFPQRFLCVTVYIFNSQNKLLMLLNKKLAKWVPPGGKVENDETPDEAAIRESFEETGIKIKLDGERPPFEGALITPIGSQCNTIKDGVRDHIDLIYVGRPLYESCSLSMAKRECSEIGWFSLQELEQIDTFDSIRYYAEKIQRFITYN